MDDKQRLQLQQMINTAGSDMVDQTALIRELKHSYVMEEEINKLLVLRDQYPDDPMKLMEVGAEQCTFLFTYYTDIFNKVRKNEIDVSLLRQFLMILRKIEHGEMDQHEGSFAVGTILKEIYIDSTLKKAEKLEQQQQQVESPETAARPAPTPKKEISWQQFKEMRNILSVDPEEQERQLKYQKQQEKKREKRRLHKEAKKLSK